MFAPRCATRALTRPCTLQARFRARKALAKYKKQFHKINLQYEVKILETRQKRRGLLFGCLQHALYLFFLLVILQTQEGNNVTTRYSLAQTLQDYVRSVEGENGMRFDEVQTLQDFGSWVETGFFANFNFEVARGVDGGGGGPTVTWSMKTYNKVRGAARLEVERVTDHCIWKSDGWNSSGQIYSYRLPEEPGCYGPLVPETIDRASFGPWWDATRYQRLPGKNRFAYDIVPSKQGRHGLREMLNDGFIDETLTRVVRLRLLTYNNALPMLCALSIEASLSSTGVLEPRFNVRARSLSRSTPTSHFLPSYFLLPTCR